MGKLKDAGLTSRDSDAVRKVVKEALKKQLPLTSASLDPKSILMVLPGAPVDSSIMIPAGWMVREEGISRERMIKGEATVENILPMPLLPVGRLRDVHEQTEALQIAWYRDGKWNFSIEDRQTLAERSKITELSQKGLLLNSSNAAGIIDYLAAFETANLCTIPCASVTKHLGWVEVAGELMFLWGEELLRAGHRFVIDTIDSTNPLTVQPRNLIQFRSDDAGGIQFAKAFHARGSFDNWLRIAQKVSEYPRVIFGLYTSLASPLLKILDVPAFVEDYAYVTSKGKTTCLRLAASCWGNPDERTPHSVVGSWNSTMVYVDYISSIANGLPVFLDDTKLAKSADQIEKVIYQVTQGRGRSRGSLKGARFTQSYSSILLSTGEEPIASLTQAGGTRARVLELWGPPFGGESRELGELVSEVNRTVFENYGHAGPRFVQFILSKKNDWSRWKKELSHIQSEYQKRAGGNSVAIRYVDSLALVNLTAAMAHAALDFPWEYADPVETIWNDLMREASEADRAAAALLYIESWMLSNAHTFLGRHESDSNNRPRIPALGWSGRWDHPDVWDYVAFYPHKLKDLLRQQAFNPEAIIRTWREKKWLKVSKNRSVDYRADIDGQKAWTVAILRSAFEEARQA
jgi:putative DNA primase/helicase